MHRRGGADPCESPVRRAARPIRRMTRRSFGRYRDCRPRAVPRSAVDERPVGVARPPRGSRRGRAVAWSVAHQHARRRSARRRSRRPRSPRGASRALRRRDFRRRAGSGAGKVGLGLEHAKGRQGEVGQPVVHEVTRLPTREELRVEANQAFELEPAVKEPQQSLRSRWLRLSAASAAITWAKPAKLRLTAPSPPSLARLDRRDDQRLGEPVRLVARAAHQVEGEAVAVRGETEEGAQPAVRVPPRT